MSNILYNEIEPAEDFNRRIQASFDQQFHYIKASEVIAELQTRCGGGKQSTTFPNLISDTEKAKLEAAGYIITPNTIDSDNRDGAGDLYIGFQVAMNAKAAENAMVISQAETNGIEGGGGSGGGGFTPTPSQLAAMNSGITSSLVSQISTTAGSVSDLEQKVAGIDSTQNDAITMENGKKLYISDSAPTDNVPDGALGIGF